MSFWGIGIADFCLVMAVFFYPNLFGKGGKMSYTLKNADIYDGEKFVKKDLFVSAGKIVAGLSESSVIDLNNCIVLPGLIDVHVHLREPGFLYKEDIRSGTRAAAHGGYTTVFAMPNLNPIPDSAKNLETELDAIKQKALIEVLPYGAITVGENGKELSALEDMAEHVPAFSDDGRGVEDEDIMLEAMRRAKKLGKIIAAHCEDKKLAGGGYIHNGEYAKNHGHTGISSESEYKPIERDLRLAKETGCRYHVCHVSTKESVELIRTAKADGVDVTCETAPHYLILSDKDLKEEGRFKMNPPLRSEEDRLALIEGIKDGTIDMIATDHAPHSADEKSGGLEKSLMGISGIETAFPLLYTHLVKPGIISLEKLVYLMHDSPMKRFGTGNRLTVGSAANLTVFNLNKEYKIESSKFLSKGKSSPFDGTNVYGKCMMTMYKGEFIWQENLTER